jgi:hypothetical protein
MKTREEVNRLKNLWLEDPAAFDLANVEGYEEYRDELNLFALEHSVNEPPIGQASNLIGPIPPDILNAIRDLFGGNSHNDNDLLDQIALPILKKLIEEYDDYPADLPFDEEKLYKRAGRKAYQRAYFILEGRNEVTRANCPCSFCEERRRQKE